MAGEVARPRWHEAGDGSALSSPALRATASSAEGMGGEGRTRRVWGAHPHDEATTEAAGGEVRGGGVVRSRWRGRSGGDPARAR